MADLLWEAVQEALEPVMHKEKEWEGHKLAKRIRDYFRKAAKTLDFYESTWLAVVNDYADSAFGSIFQAIGDRHWLGEVDFLFVVDAGIKECFPSHVVGGVPVLEFERGVLAAHDRAFEEQRYLPRLWEIVESLGLVGKARKKTYDAVDEARRAAVKYMRDVTSPNEVKAFLSRWVDCTVRQLSKSTQGDPASAMPEAAAIRLFHALLKAEAMPIALTAEHGQSPAGWPFVDFAVRAAYKAHGGDADDAADKGRLGKGRGKRGVSGGPSRNQTLREPGRAGLVPQEPLSPPPASLTSPEDRLALPPEGCWAKASASIPPNWQPLPGQGCSAQPHAMPGSQSCQVKGELPDRNSFAFGVPEAAVPPPLSELPAWSREPMPPPSRPPTESMPQPARWEPMQEPLMERAGAPTGRQLSWLSRENPPQARMKQEPEHEPRQPSWLNQDEIPPHDSWHVREPEQGMWRGGANGHFQDNHRRPMQYATVKQEPDAPPQQALPVQAPSIYTRTRVKQEPDSLPLQALPVEAPPFQNLHAPPVHSLPPRAPQPQATQPQLSWMVKQEPEQYSSGSSQARYGSAYSWPESKRPQSFDQAGDPRNMRRRMDQF
eukprot:TRINITY_DN19506_c0_g2_i1.p1 TRINITY_DN19506_c0_g2~~TRINITY_DN19506_c0_g2_i1.p1  ORF type:complete len:603 (-),score=108.65 TRINITY_DN19506_c0_g2_i1:87-1895(-)